jgi:hypothetical protein
MMPSAPFVPAAPFTAYLSSQIAARKFSGVREQRFDGGRVLLYDEARVMPMSLGDDEDEDDNLFAPTADLNYKVFTSTDDDKLAALANDPNYGKPLPEEVLVYITAGSTPYVRVRAGSKFLRDNRRLNDRLRKGKAIDPPGLIKLLRAMARGAKKFFSKLLGIYHDAVVAVGAGVEEFLQGVIDRIEGFAIDEKYWNPVIDSDGTYSDVKKTVKALRTVIEQQEAQFDTIVSLLDRFFPDAKADPKDERIALLYRLRSPLIGVFKVAKGAAAAMRTILDTVDIGVDALQMTVSLICGVWNGLIDAIAGLVHIVKMASDFYFAIHSGALKVATKSTDLIGLANEMFTHMAEIDWLEVLKAGIEGCQKLLGSVGRVPGKLEAAYAGAKDKAAEAVGEQVDGLNRFNICYYLGFGLTWLIPFGIVAKVLGKAGKAGEVLVKIFKFLDDLAATMLGPAFRLAGKGIKEFMALIRGLIAFLKKGTEAVTKALTEFFERLKKWLDGAGVKAVDDKVDDAASALTRMTAETEQLVADLKNVIKDITHPPRGLFTDMMRGNFGEVMTDLHFLDRVWDFGNGPGRFKKVSAHNITDLKHTTRHTGIDAVYEFNNPPPRFVVVESKFGSATLNRKATKSGGSQMTKAWIRFDLYNLADKKARRDIMDGGYESVLSKVSQHGEITLKGLDEYAKPTGKWGT